MRKYKIKDEKEVICFHCGERCKDIIFYDEKEFCCDGCKLVYDLLKENNLCTYYSLNAAPGVSPSNPKGIHKFNYLDHEAVSNKLLSFNDGDYAKVSFYIPKMHCSSCIWLLENLHKLNPNIISSSVNFLKKEITIAFKVKEIKLSEIASLLSHVGYEPLIHLNDLEKKTKPAADKTRIIKIGIAGFCFGNIMMLSFPEYFSLGNFYEQKDLSFFFGYLNLLLAIPVFFYCASEFFVSAWKSIRYRYLNIDAPIALAILVTFSRSLFEIISQTGAGYMDSMTGIVFFMLIGRYFQNRTYETLSFERDYKSFFPVGVTVRLANGKETEVPLSELKKGDIMIIRNNEIIPADGILLEGRTHIDYSFITGESAAVRRFKNDMIYAGGKQLDGAVEIEVMNPVSQSYLTQLWNKGNQKASLKENKTYIDNINKYFTIAVLCISGLSALFWLYVDSSRSLNALTAVLIVACPCGLLLTSTFAHGNVVRIMGRSKFYLKSARVIDQLAKADTIIFDKTGTISNGSSVDFLGAPLNEVEMQMVISLAAQSSHPLSKKIVSSFSVAKKHPVAEFKEIPGRGIKGFVKDQYIIMGSDEFVTGVKEHHQFTRVFLMINGKVKGFFRFYSAYRGGLNSVIASLRKDHQLALLSGDNDAERNAVEIYFGKNANLNFNQKPEDKMKFVEELKAKGHQVMMIGDGLNDAGAFMKSDVGIAVSDDTNNFSPACDAILDGSSFRLLPHFIALARGTRKAVIATFAISLVYNIAGLYFAVQGNLSPVIAAVLMPLSSITIVLLATVFTNLSARFNNL